MTLVPSNNSITMNSLELVDLINLHREGGRAELLHKNFMVKIEKHPGIDSAKFLAQYKDGTGRVLKCYRLPKREAELMVMSESLKVQTSVYDKMAEAEAKTPTPIVKDPRTAALIESLVRFDAIEQEQNRQAVTLARIQEDVAVIEARTQPENKHFTVMGYANLIGQSVDIKNASKLGRRCATLSKEQGLPIGDIKDPRFGYVHSYHETILQAVFDGSGCDHAA